MNDIQQQIQTVSSFLNLNDKKKLLLVVPESAGDIFLSTSLLSSLNKNYADYEIYFACRPQFKSILKNNPYITKVIDYIPVMENQIVMEGTGNWKGLFDISIMATVLTQRYINYLNNGKTKIMFDLRSDNAHT